MGHWTALTATVVDILSRSKKEKELEEEEGEERKRKGETLNLNNSMTRGGRCRSGPVEVGE